MHPVRTIKALWAFLFREIPEAFMDGYDPFRKPTYKGYADRGRR